MKKRSYELPMLNREYKDTIFRWIFSIIENLLSLYNAVTGKNYQNPEDLDIVTLENAIYMGMKNDLAFVLEMGLYLYEHQSTYNPNIPLRDLFYIASEYQDLVDEKSLYSCNIIGRRYTKCVYLSMTKKKKKRSSARLNGSVAEKKVYRKV